MILSLPSKSQVSKVVPKNAFDDYTNTKQKRKFIDIVNRLTWINKLSFDTVNLKGKDVKEIQVFQLELKQQEGFNELLQIIDKVIPYHIIFCVLYKEKVLFSASQKHLNPINENQAVTDWTFSSDWEDVESNLVKVNLEKSLDFVFYDFCKQLIGDHAKGTNLFDLISYDKSVKELNKSITALETSISKAKQFNKKVELNIELQEKLTFLKILMS